MILHDDALAPFSLPPVSLSAQTPHRQRHSELSVTEGSPCRALSPTVTRPSLPVSLCCSVWLPRLVMWTQTCWTAVVQKRLSQGNDPHVVVTIEFWNSRCPLSTAWFCVNTGFQNTLPPSFVSLLIFLRLISIFLSGWITMISFSVCLRLCSPSLCVLSSAVNQRPHKITCSRGITCFNVEGNVSVRHENDWKSEIKLF